MSFSVPLWPDASDPPTSAASPLRGGIDQIPGMP